MTLIKHWYTCTGASFNWRQLLQKCWIFYNVSFFFDSWLIIESYRARTPLTIFNLVDWKCAHKCGFFEKKVAHYNFQLFSMQAFWLGAFKNRKLCKIFGADYGLISIGYDAILYENYAILSWAILTHWLPCHLQLAMMSLCLCSTSDVITFDQNWPRLCSISAGGNNLSNDIQIRVISRLFTALYFLVFLFSHKRTGWISRELDASTKGRLDWGVGVGDREK